MNKNSNNPSQEQINNLLGYYQKGRFDYAEKLATSITNEFPNHPFGWKVLGALFGQSGRNLEACVTLSLMKERCFLNQKMKLISKQET